MEKTNYCKCKKPVVAHENSEMCLNCSLPLPSPTDKGCCEKCDAEMWDGPKGKCYSDYHCSCHSPSANETEKGEICPHCNMDKALRNPSGFCDHLFYPENCPTCSAPDPKELSWEEQVLELVAGHPDKNRPIVVLDFIRQKKAEWEQEAKSQGMVEEAVGCFDHCEQATLAERKRIVAELRKGVEDLDSPWPLLHPATTGFIQMKVKLKTILDENEKN